MYFIRNNGGYEVLRSEARIRGGGWLLISDDIAKPLLAALPFVALQIEGDVVVGFEQVEPHPAPEPQIDDITALQLAVAEMAEIQTADQTANELALVELAEMMGG